MSLNIGKSREQDLRTFVECLVITPPPPPPWKHAMLKFSVHESTNLSTAPCPERAVLVFGDNSNSFLDIIPHEESKANSSLRSHLGYRIRNRVPFECRKFLGIYIECVYSVAVAYIKNI